MDEPSREYLYVFLLILVFVSGFFVLYNNNIRLYEISENFVSSSTSPTTSNSKCPNLLVKRDGKYFLFYMDASGGNHFPFTENGSSSSSSTNNTPLIFNTLQEYATYIQNDKFNCPVLFLQKENDPQGNDVYRIRQNPFYVEGGLPPLPLVVHDNSIPIVEKDASRENGFNQNMFPGFDPYGLYVGRYTEKDVVHDSTSKNEGGSYNAMDPNWRGVIETQQAIDKGTV